jgi:hypothetical protein
LGTLVNDSTRHSKDVWVLSASTGLITIAFDWISRRFDDEDAKVLRKEIESTKQSVAAVKRKTDRRLLSETGKLALKAVSAKYPNQKFSVYVMKPDEEAVPFAMQITAILAGECDWSGHGASATRLIGINPATAFPGLGITQTPLNGSVGWADEIIKELNSVFEADGISPATIWNRLAGESPGDQSKEGTIEFNVGRRPT